MNVFKRAGKKLKKAGKATIGTIKSAGRNIDITYSKGLVGKYTAPIAKPVIATTAMTLSGGAVALARPDLVKPAIAGFQAGAALGGAVKAGGSLGGVEAGANVVASSYMPASMTESGAVINEGMPTNGVPNQTPRNPGIGLLVIGGLALLVYSLTGKRA